MVILVPRNERFVADLVTLFPEMFVALSHSGVTRRALEEGRWSVNFWNPRDFTEDVHRTVDDRPYVYLSPQGAPLTHRRVMQFVQDAGNKEGMVLLCGRYEGVDERLIERFVDEEISIGDFVLSGGEIPAMALLDAIVRQLPGVLNDAESAQQDSFVAGLLDCPHYTRPEEYEGQRVPDVLLSGHHEQIRRWRKLQA